MNNRQRLRHLYTQLPLIDQLELSAHATFKTYQHHPRRLALPGTLAGGIITFTILIPLAMR